MPPETFTPRELDVMSILWDLGSATVSDVQGRLSDRTLTASLRTECAQSHQEITLRVDSELRVDRVTDAASPVISLPLVNFKKLDVDYIYDDL